MGFLGDIIATAVLRYKVDADQAVKDIKNLSAEQQKAAKDQAKALQAQGKEVQSLGEKYAKGAALIAGAYVVIKQGMQDLATESRLAAGSAGVDIDKLDKAAGGLKTRWELMALAQAGSQGAWKLTTQQLGYVVEGMRALEKKGYDATEVQNALTESLKKGKLEGLDKFGLSIKSTGTAAGDLRSLMRQLSQSARDVGYNFDKAGDAAVRAGVKFSNARARAGTALGTGIDYGIQGIEAAGRGTAALVSGESYFQEDLGAQLLGFGTKAQRIRMGVDANQRREAKRRMDADVTSTFAMFERWRSKAKVLEDIDKMSKGGGADAVGDSAYRSLLERGGAFASRVGRFGQRQALLEERIADAEIGDAGNIERKKWEDAIAGRETLKRQAELDMAEADKRRSYLASIFGPVEEFDAYAEGFGTLSDAVRSAGDSILSSLIANEKVTGASVRRAVGAVIGAKSHELWAQGLSTTLTSLWPLNPAGLAAGAAMIGGSVLLGKVAGQFGGQGASGGAGSGGGGGAAGARSMGQDHRGDRQPAGWGGSGFGDRVLVLSGIHDDESPAYRARRTRDALRRAGAHPPPQGTGQA